MNQREAFEKWCTKDGLYGPLQKDQCGNYVENTAQCCWQAWQAAQQAQWQPIETAPRDGTVIMIYEKDAEIAYFEDGMFQDGEYYFDPDYWMPLPPEPKP